MEQRPDPGTRDQHTRVWLSVLGVLCLGIFVCGYFFSKNSSSDLAFIFAYNLPVGLIIWAVFHSLVGRKLDKTHAAFSLLAILGSLVAAGLIGYSQQKTAAIQVITEIQKGYSSLVGSATNSGGVRKPVETPLNTTPTARGEMGELERFMKTFMNQMASQRKDYMLELNAIGWERVLDPERVRSDKTLIESRTIIQNAKDIVSKYKQRTSALLEKARNDIANLNMSESSKRELKSGFEKGMAKSSAQIKAMWEYEAQAVSEFENIFALLSARRGKWVVQDGQILFSSEADLKEFNQHLASIQTLVSKQEAIQKQSVENVNRNLDNLKN